MRHDIQHKRIPPNDTQHNRLFATLGINDAQLSDIRENDTQLKGIECRYAECRYTKCRYAECCYAESRVILFLRCGSLC